MYPKVVERVDYSQHARGSWWDTFDLTCEVPKGC